MSAILAVAIFQSTRTSGYASFANDSRFVVTSTRVSFSGKVGVIDRIFLMVNRIRQMLGKSDPNVFFTASATNRCSIDAFLTSCTHVTSVHYVVAKEVAAGTVEFGNSKTMSGLEWSGAFTSALQHGQPEWYVASSKTFRKENLVMVTNDAKTVLVLPKEMAEEFQRRSLK